MFFYKAVNNLVFVDCEALPATRRLTRFTRSSSSNTITHIPKQSRTVTYQRSFFIRTCRAWNVLPDELRTNHISLASFKRLLLQCYNRAPDLYLTTLTTSEPGEQSVPSATQRGLSCTRRLAAFSNLNFRLSLFFPVYLLVALVICYIFYLTWDPL